MAEEELEAIQAIYCRPGELSVSQGLDESRQVTLQLSSESDSDDVGRLPSLTAELRLLLPASYPAAVPTISVFSDHLTRNDLSQLRTTLCQCAEQNLGQPALMDIISLATEELLKLRAANHSRESKDTPSVGNKASPQTVPGGESGDPSGTSCDRVVLLHLDHMRAKAQYVKLIRKWVADLSLTGRLIFCQRLILIVLQGESASIKEYIVRQRTSNVDVDSRGHPCKERMLSVLWEGPVDRTHSRFADFEVSELGAPEELKAFFRSSGIGDLYDNHVESLRHFPGK
ncbi:hypothetical protein BaRGS_00013757 [Batillaria attramentaria]|uniref:RWD domain-containing protein 3 n=1 Tax=Batillaria attramentaria TaxID=370345 RepID=A0ABD0L7G7_9CAEN